MTEQNIFCYSTEYNNQESFQQKRFRAFNKEVGEGRYCEIKNLVETILGKNKTSLQDFWKEVTNKQWSQLLAIPEAKDFNEGFEFISGVKIKEDVLSALRHYEKKAEAINNK